MKTSLLRILVISLLIVYYNSNAQKITNREYENFYNSVKPNLDLIIPNKTEFYGQNFSNFYDELINRDLVIKSISITSEPEKNIQKNMLALYFGNDKIMSYGVKRGFQCPVVFITFADYFPEQLKDMVKQNSGYWTTTLESFFSERVIQKIEFVGVNGAYNTDKTVK